MQSGGTTQENPVAGGTRVAWHSFSTLPQGDGAFGTGQCATIAYCIVGKHHHLVGLGFGFGSCQQKASSNNNNKRNRTVVVVVAAQTRDTMAVAGTTTHPNPFRSVLFCFVLFCFVPAPLDSCPDQCASIARFCSFAHSRIRTRKTRGQYFPVSSHSFPPVPGTTAMPLKTSCPGDPSSKRSRSSSSRRRFG